MNISQRAILVLLLLGLPARADPQHATIRVTSHGASATCIITTANKSWILGCAHAFEGKDRYKPIRIDTNSPNPGQAQGAVIKLLAVDYHADLSLCEISTRLPYVCPVAPAGSRPGRLWSCGYDHMKWPITVRNATSLGSDSSITYTREAPIPGRSGGGLIDPDQKRLYGVVVGFEVLPGNRPGVGMYVSHNKILTFLRANQHLIVDTPGPAFVQQPLPPPPQQGSYYYVLQQPALPQPAPQPGIPQTGRPWVSEQRSSPQCPT